MILIKPKFPSFLRSSPWLRGAQFIIGFVVTVMFMGCTTVHVHNAEVTSDSRFGILSLKISPEAKGAALITTRGLGLTLGGYSTALGYINETVFFASDATRCRLFILAQTTAEFEAIQSLLQRNGMNPESICLMTGGEP